MKGSYNRIKGLMSKAKKGTREEKEEGNKQVAEERICFKEGEEDLALEGGTSCGLSPPFPFLLFFVLPSFPFS